MAKKIPTHRELKLLRELQEIERKQEIRKITMDVLYDKSLKMYFHSALALEAHDVLVPTVAYNKAFKRDGNLFVGHLTKIIERNYERIYSQDPEFTTNMFRKIEEVVDLMTKVEFGDYPLLLELLKEFNKDKEYWRENVVAKFVRLDTGEVKEAKYNDPNES